MTETTCGHQPFKAKGLCRSCYKKAWRAAQPKPEPRPPQPRPTRETTCGHGPHCAKGLCKNCYRRTYEREKDRARLQAWQEANREKTRENARKYAANNRESQLARTNRWRAENPEKARELGRGVSRRYRARKWTTEADLTNDQWTAILAEFDHRCAYCNVGGVPMEQEHMTPLCRGGRHTASNVVPSCGPCNRSKNRRTALEWVGPEWSSCG